MFLFCDHIVWFARTGFVKSVDVEKWNRLSNKYWLFSMVMNLLRDFYEIKRLLQMQPPKKNPENKVRLPLDTLRCICDHKAVMWDTIKNVCDLFIPLNGLGIIRLNPRTIGLLGLISSLAGLVALIEPTAKLSPA